MDGTNNPDSGAGYTPAEATEHIAKFLDSETTTTQNVDADEGFDFEPSNESVDETTTETDFEPDQSDEVEGVAEDTEQTEEAPSAFDIPEDALITIGDEQVSGKELLDGYMRRSDYTRKTQEVSELKKQYAEVQADKHVHRGQLDQHLDAILTQVAMEFQTLQEPDWDYLRQYDFPTYMQEKENYQRREATVKQLADAKNEIARKDAEHLAQLRRQAIEDAKVELQTLRPEFKDPKVAQAGLVKTEDYLLTYGFSPDEISTVQDAKIIDIVLKAIAYDDMQKKVPAARKHIEDKAPITMPQGVKTPSVSADQAFQRDVNRLKRSGSQKDAISVISKLL